MRQLEADPKWVAARAREDAVRAQKLAKLRRAAEPIVRDLEASGFSRTNEWDLVNTRERYDEALPVLLKHLALPYPDRIREGLARALGRPWARHQAWDHVFAHYVAEPNFLDRGPLDAVGTTSGPKDGMAVALSEMAKRSDLDQLIELISDPKNGPSRVFFVANLTRSRSPKAFEALIHLRSDPDLTLEIEAKLKGKLRRQAKREGTTAAKH